MFAFDPKRTLDQQPADISYDSPGCLTANAVRLCEALNATIYLRDGDAVVIHAGHRRHSPGTGKFDLGACLLTTRRSRVS